MKCAMSEDGNRALIFCPGCETLHSLNTDPSKGRPCWNFNGSESNPTFSPSLLYPNKPRCHSFIRDGKIQFLGDCDHSLAGMTVDLPEFNGLKELFEMI